MASDVTVADRIRTELAKHLKRDISMIQPQYSLREDLGMDSADSIELVFSLEQMFDFEVPDQDFRKFTTVSSVIQYVEERLQAA